MHNDLTLQELSDDELEMVVGGSHSQQPQP